MRLLVIDNYDSFTWNLVHYLQAAGADVDVRRNDAAGAASEAMRAQAVVISPGPGTPDGAGVTLAVVAGCAARGIPLLGVCLGHQAIAQVFGGRVARGSPMHGKTSPVTHGGISLFEGLPSPFQATRYHSLVVESDVPDTLGITATSDDGTIMGLSHRTLPLHGVQFHPESVASDGGHRLIANFLKLADEANGVRS